MNASIIVEHNRRLRKKRENWTVDKRKDTLIKKAFKIGEFDGIEVAVIDCHY
jgi:hypothetical protein